MAPLSIAFAFLLGFGARRIGLPPLVGFLIAGFVLQAFSVESSEALQTIADLGVTLLLFTIGLKLKLKTLAKPEVWGGASLHALITVAVFGVLLLALATTGLPGFAGLNAGSAFLIAFALSFSSTVFAVKVLEEKGEIKALHGRTSIGILIVQDVFAVLFLVASSGKLPDPGAILLIPFLFALRPLLSYLLDHIGHDELMPLFGLFAAMTLGVATFDYFGVKPDLGALILGMLMAPHKRASEIADSLFAFKEVFLVGFFLSIGLSAPPTIAAFAIACLLVVLIPLKTGLFFLILTRFHLRARSSLLGALALSTYSEFGLIVAAVGVDQGWLDPSWLIIIALALSISFALAAPANSASLSLYARYRSRLLGFETDHHHPDEVPLDLGTAKIVVLGMGRIGSGAYDYLQEHCGDVVIGIEISPERVQEHLVKGRNVIQGDAADQDFWEQMRHRPGGVEVVLLAMPDHDSNMYALQQITAANFEGLVAAIAQYQDQIDTLLEAGANFAFSTHAEAGSGFGAEVHARITAKAEPMPEPAI